MPVWIITAFIVVSVLCVFGAVKLYSGGYNTYGKGALAGYVFYAVVFAAVWVFDVTVPPYTLLLTMLTVLGSSFFGHYLGCYTSSRTFDRYLHAFGTFSFALFIYCILDDLTAAGGSVLFRSIFVFMTGNAAGAVFELVEMGQDVKKPEEPKSQKGLRDTDMDMLFNLIGSVLAGIFAYMWLLE